MTASVAGADDIDIGELNIADEVEEVGSDAMKIAKASQPFRAAYYMFICAGNSPWHGFTDRS